MSTKIADPFYTSTEAIIDGRLEPKGDTPWSGYTYTDAKGATWSITALVKDDNGAPVSMVSPAIAIIKKLLEGKKKPAGWRANMVANEYESPDGKTYIAMESGQGALVDVLTTIDQRAYAAKLAERGTFPWGLVLLVGLILMDSKKR